MRITSKLGRIAAVVSVSGVVLLGATTASAYEPFATSAPLAKDSVTGPGQIKDGTVYGADLAPGMVKWFTGGPYNNTVGKPQLKADVAGELQNGAGSVVKTVPDTKITDIGGKFADRATSLGGFKLPHGTWLVTTNATFNRTVAAAATDTKTRPQLALRAGGLDAGTIMGVDISPAVGRELKGATVATITVSEVATIVSVYGFGYNDDSSSFASGDITVSAQITATRIG
jgi:hypothetical protein